mgnify:CR=1 FL=1
MTFVDPIGDMITRIRNAQMRMLNNVRIPGSKFREKILDVLKQEGYIADYKLLLDANNKSSLSVDLKYNNGLPVIKEIKRVSKPGRRVYSSIKNLQKTYNGLGISILSTPRGVMSDNEAREANVGGEVLCTIY